VVLLKSKRLGRNAKIESSSGDSAKGDEHSFSRKRNAGGAQDQGKNNYWNDMASE